ncbi:MAG: L,D-transpeptidase family protein [Lachnospiraceae bacterium]|nr:L,D-transpeptidase family protein [Lachnospiraceae bacterium]
MKYLDRPSKSSGKKILIIVLSVLLGLLLVLYLGMAIFFLSHFQFNTQINGEDVSGKTESDVEKIFLAEAQDFTMTIQGRENQSGTISGKTIGLEPVFDGSIGELLSDTNAFAWPVSLFKASSYKTDSVGNYNAMSLEAAVNATGIFDSMRSPEDAHLSDFQEGGYTIIPEDKGTTLDKQKVYAVVGTAAASLINELNLEEEGCYIDPQVFSDDATLTALSENLNHYAALKITIPYGSETEVLDGAVIGDWLTVSGTNVSLDESAIKDYVDTLARAHDTFGISRSFHTTAGSTITVKGGDYGWWTDRPSTTQALLAMVKEGKSGEFTPVYFAEAAQYGENDYGTSYVEIDLDNQHVYVYKNGSLVTQSSCVSGKVANGNYTPNGTYSITYKERNGTLVGEGYSSPVDYWMPFNGNIGMHDAPWRSSFGGDIYLRSGSHGCVNLPTSGAKSIFENVEKGEAVIVYGGKQSVPAPAPAPEPTPEDPNAQPADPNAQPADPNAQPADPNAQPADPNAQVTDPAAQTTDPAAQPADPAAQTVDPAAQAADPAAQAAQ